jgi:predicted nucleic acid-binding protein
MAISVYIDTNIIMDLLDEDRRKHSASVEKITAQLNDDAELSINSDTLTTSFYLLRSQKKATVSESLSALRKITKICNLVTVEMPQIDQALTLCEDPDTDFNDYEDALQYVCACKINAEAILTNDQGFVSPDVAVWRS